MILSQSFVFQTNQTASARSPAPAPSLPAEGMALAFVDSITRSRVCVISERTKGGFETELSEHVSSSERLFLVVGCGVFFFFLWMGGGKS